MRLRPYREADAEALATVYRAAVQALGRQAYTEEQTRVWALHPESLEAFRTGLAQGLTLCAEVAGAPVAFGQLDPPDHIAYLYCHPDHARRGLASLLLARLIERAGSLGVATLRTEASAVARPLFERFGFRVVAEERPIRHGVAFLRFRMEKRLGQEPDSPAGRRPGA